MDPARKQTIGYSLFALLGLGGLLLIIWLVDQHRAASARASFLSGYGGRFTAYDEPSLPVANQPPWGQRLFGDRPIELIELQYGLHDRVPRRAKELFPEATTIRFEPGERAVARLFDGEDGLEILRHPDSVEACLLEVPNKKTVSSEIAGGYQTKGKEIEVPVETAAPLSDMLLKPESYKWDTLSACYPEFGVRVTWRRASERIDLLVCFNCGQILIYRDNLLVRLNRDIKGALRDRLLSATKSLFPDDAAIQALKPCGSGATPEPLPVAH